jgi:1,4-dihydroxy-6-naphthoate synthase
MKKFSLGYSPCPNDTFIFYALANKKLYAGLEFSEEIRDVETLNKKALRNELDITKVSFHAFGFLREDYCLLHAGSALGKGCGPLIVAKEPIHISDLEGKKIAIPGKMTTAYLLLRLFNNEIENMVEMPFEQIMNAVSLGTVDAGLIIHEGRFTYPAYDLIKLVDLGEWWEEMMGLPLPLGGIIAKRNLGKEVIKEIDRLVKKSIQYAFSQQTHTREYIKRYAQELDDIVIDQHIQLYVNNFTLDIGEGAAAVEKLLGSAEKLKLIPHSDKPLFID